jgi:hypothetical protein
MPAPIGPSLPILLAHAIFALQWSGYEVLAKKSD